MKQYIVRRLLLAMVTLIGVSLLIFLIMRAIPGDVAISILGEGANEQTVAELRQHLGLDDSWYLQYGRWVQDMTHGDMGHSLFLANKPVTHLMAEHFPVTLNLSLYTMVVAVILGVALGMISGLCHDTWIDYACRVFSVTGLSIPVFWLGLMILLTMVRLFAWTPELVWVSPFDNFWRNFQQMFWPALTLGYFQVAFIARMTRSSILEVLVEEYIRTARAKGLREQMVVMKHALRNVVIPIVTIGSLQFVALLGGVVVTERVFNLKGWGSLLVSGVINHDYPLVQTMIFIFAGLVIAANLLTDILYGWLDPRIRYQ